MDVTLPVIRPINHCKRFERKPTLFVGSTYFQVGETIATH